MAADKHAVGSAELLNATKLAPLIIDAEQLHSANLHFLQKNTEGNMFHVVWREAHLSDDDTDTMLLKQDVSASNNFKVEPLRVNFQKVNTLNTVLLAKVIQSDNRHLLRSTRH